MQFDVAAGDSDWDRVSLSASSLPSGARFDLIQTSWSQVRGRFSWKVPEPPGDEVQEFPVIFTASDAGTTTTRTVVVRLCGPAVVNCETLRFSPTIDPIPPKTVVQGSQLRFFVTARDKNPDTILLRIRCTGTMLNRFTQRCDSTPVGATLQLDKNDEPGRTTGTFTWTPWIPGTYAVTFNAHDGRDGQALRTVAITVTPNPASLPDLTVVPLGWPATATVGTVSFTYMLKNEGTADAGAPGLGFLTRLLVDGQPVPDGNGRVGSRYTTFLPRGGSNVNAFQWLATCGTHQVVVETDAAGIVRRGETS